MNAPPVPNVLIGNPFQKSNIRSVGFDLSVKYPLHAYNAKDIINKCDGFEHTFGTSFPGSSANDEVV
jgi:hypothetical protein